MKRLCLTVPLILALAAPAAAQRITIKISPREGGGETVGFGPAEDSQQPQVAPAPTGDAGRRIGEIAQRVLDEIASTSRLSPGLATDTIRQLTESTVAAAGASPRWRVPYDRTLSYAAAVTGDLPTAREAADRWRQAAATDPAAVRNQLMLAILAGDGDAAGAAVKSLSVERHARWLPWTTYMSNFLPLVGAQPEFRLLDLDATRQADKIVVVCFTGSSADDPLLARLTRTYQRRPVVVHGARLGPSSDAATNAAAKALGVTAAPTACVFGRDGRVLFAGDPRTWEVHTAVASALAPPPSSATVATDPPRPPAYTDDQLRTAWEMRDRGWDLARLAAKTRSPTHRQQARELWEQIIREYPGSAAAVKAKQDLQNLDR